MTRRRDERGAIAIIASLMSVVMFVMCSLVVDLGMARDTRRQAQNAADAASLAGANALFNSLDSSTNHSTALATAKTGAVAAVKAYMLSNYGTPASAWAGCTDSQRPATYVAIGGPCISIDANNPTKVRVRTPTRHVSTPFAALIGTTSVDIAASAEAGREALGGSLACGLCILGTTPTPLTGGSQIRVANANIHTNGYITLTGGGTSVTDVGGTTGASTAGSSTSGGATFSPAVISEPTITDPLFSLWNQAVLPPAFPATVNVTNFSIGSSPCSMSPGRYTNISIAVNCTMQPGTYVITGSFQVNGGRIITAPGVTLYFTCGTAAAPVLCASATAGGRMSFTGGSQISISPPTSGPLKGLSVVSDYHNTGAISLTGGSATPSSGTWYVPAANLTYTGGSVTTPTDAVVVVNQLTLTGGSVLNLASTAGNNVDSPAPMHLTK